ncbi:SpoOM protein [Jeongeupia sp. HS-3]|uniref:sporulation protein n=1 Tax=Jeongeupia sp. HS-3 TaxID=1009682 RepID=UPI0018A621B3|nr:sporulation protein [Jeongeupia sp. HS-3]BCL77036.1 SpoOM protein [Jeongeupia sp. HS-3]
MFRSLLAAAGFGGAQVDTRIVRSRLVPGGTLLGEVVLKGGAVDQTIEGLQLVLCTQVEVESDNGEYTKPHALAHWPLNERFVLRAGETMTIPLNATLPGETPVTALPCHDNRTHVWLETRLEIASAIDASDRDPLVVEPTEAMQCTIAAMGSLGYALVRADVEAGYLQTQAGNSQSGCYQELEFRPSGYGGIAEVEVSFLPGNGATHLIIEIDRRHRGDSYRVVSVPHAGLSAASVQRMLAPLFS